MKKDVKVSDEELKRRKKSMRALKTCMIVLDVIAIILLSVQITIFKEITWVSHILLILCNVLVFSINIEKSSDLSFKKTGKKK